MMGIIGQHCARLVVLIAIFLGTLSNTVNRAPAADVSKAAKTETQTQPEQPAEVLPQPATTGGLQVQELDDKIEPLHPVTPRTAGQQKNIEALTWYSVGRMHFKRGRNQEALQAFQNAAQQDPQSVAILESLLLTSHSLNRGSEMVEYAKKIVELDPHHLLALNIMALHYKNQDDFPAAIKSIEQAVASPHLKKDSLTHVKIRQLLGELYNETENSQKAAESFEVVFDAVENPQQYELSENELNGILAETSYEQLGNSFYDGDKLDMAIKAYQRALETKSGNAGNTLYNLSRAYLKSKKPDEALAQLQKYLDSQRQSRGRAAYELLAEILAAQGKQDELISRLRGLADKDRRNETLQYFLAESLINAEALEEAEAVLNETLSHSQTAEGYAMLVSVHHKQNRPNELLHSLSRAYAAKNSIELIAVEMLAIAKNADLVESMIEAGRELKEEDADFAHQFILAQLASEVEKADVAEEFFRSALTKTRVSEQKYDAYQNLADLLRTQRKFAEAEEVLQQAIDDQVFLVDVKSRIRFQDTLAVVLEFSGETDRALETVHAAMETQGLHPLLLLDLKLREGWVYTHSRRYEDAISYYEQILKDYSKVKEITKIVNPVLSNIYVQQGDMKKGTQLLEELYREDPDDIRINNDLGYFYAEQGINLEQAEEMIRKAIKAKPEVGAYLDSLGWVLYKRGKFAEALPPLEQAVGQPDGQDATIYDHLGDVYLRLEKPDKAIESWEKAVKLSEEDAGRNEKLLERIKEKLKNQKNNPSKLRPEREGSP